MRKIFVAIPCGDTIDTNFAESLVNLETPEDCELYINFAAGSLVYDARNNLAQRAVQSGCDLMLWLDSDMSFEPDLIRQMLESLGDKEFLSALYFSRRPPFRALAYKTCDWTQKEDGTVDIQTDIYKPLPEGVFEIAACGYGTVLCKISLYAEIFERGGLPFSPIIGLGEDLSACLRIRNFGHKLYCDSNIYVGHTAKIVIGGASYKQSWNESE